MYKSEAKRKKIVGELFTDLRNGLLGMLGQPFPPIRVVAKRYNISHVTAFRIVQDLAQEGLLVRKGRNYVLTHMCGATNTPKKLGVILSNMNNSYFMHLFFNLQQVAREHKIDLIATSSNYDSAAEKRQIEILQESGADAFLISPCDQRHSIENIKAIKQPVVLFSHAIRSVPVPVVSVNNSAVGRMAAEKLLASHCRHFYYLGTQHITDDLRLEGYAQHLKAHGYALKESHCLSLEHDCNIEPILRLLGEIKEFPCGIFCFHDLFAMRCLRAAHVLNLKIPDQVSVIGCDNLEGTEECWPPLSTIGYSKREMAETAIRLLLGNRLEPAEYLIDPFFIQRKTSSMPSVSRP